MLLAIGCVAAAGLFLLAPPDVLAAPITPSVRSFQETFPAAGGDFAAALPAGHALDDVLVLYVEAWKSGGGQTVATPSGYTLVGSATSGANVHAVFVKVDDGSEGSPTVDLGTDAGYGVAAVFAVQDSDGVVTDGGVASIGSGTTLEPGPVTAGAAGDFVLSIVAGENQAYSATETDWADAGHAYDSGYSVMTIAGAGRAAASVTTYAGATTFAGSIGSAGGVSLSFGQGDDGETDPPPPDSIDCAEAIDPPTCNSVQLLQASIEAGVPLSSDDRDRIDLSWWGSWAIVGLLLVLIIVPAWNAAWKWGRE